MDIHISLAAEELFKVGPVPVTNSMLTMFLVMAVVLVAGILIARRATLVPGGRAQGLAEMLVGFIADLVDGSGGRKIGRTVLPFIMGIFVFILFSNFSGLLPGVGTIGKYEEHAVEESHAPTLSGGAGGLLGRTRERAPRGIRIRRDDDPADRVDQQLRPGQHE